MGTFGSGIPTLDKLLGGFQAGDNVVWIGEAKSFTPVFVSAFVHAAGEGAKKTLVYVNSNCAPQTLARRFVDRDPGIQFVQVDAFTNGKGKGDSVFREHYKNRRDPEGFRTVLLEKPYEAETFSRELSALEDEYGESVRYVFDSLTGLSELWGGERPAQEFFTHHCPKLYELQTVAYWVLEREAHTRPFVANLSHITQVVIQLRPCEEGVCEMEFQKAEDRPSRILFEPLRYRAARDQVEFDERAPDREVHLGKRIKAMRTGWDLSQAELARRLNITPSGLCQIENDQVQPSLAVLMNLSRILRCSLDSLIHGETEARNGVKGWLVHKKRDQAVQKAASRSAVEVSPLLPERAENRQLTPYLLKLRPQAEGDRGFFDHKGPEFGWIMKGLMRIAVKDEQVVLRSGDSIYLEGETVKRWCNAGKSDCELIWVLA